MSDSSPAARLTITEQLELVLPTGSRSRRFAQAGLVVWAAIGVALLIGTGFILLAKLTGLLPYLIVAGLDDFVALSGRFEAGNQRRAGASIARCASGARTPRCRSVAICSARS